MPTVCASIATRCQHQGEGPEVNKFEQFCSDGDQMSLAEGEWGSLSSEVPGGLGCPCPGTRGAIQ